MSRHISLDSLRDREYALHEHFVQDDCGDRTATDRYMRDNNERLGEDSEELAVREKRARKVLSERPLPSYHPFE